MSGRPVSARLLERLQAEGIVPAEGEVRVERTNASGLMRVNGAWSWFAWWGEGKPRQTAGSQWPMADCLAAPFLHAGRNDFGEMNVDPYTAPPGTPGSRLYFGKTRKGR